MVRNYNRKQIGVVGVDSGQIVVCDPAYLDSEWELEDYNGEEKPSKENFSYNACCQATMKKGYGQLNFKLGHAGAGVVTTSGEGDGCYPVFATFNNNGRIKKIEIIFIED